jgi:predicted ATP-dependent serine protease
MSSSAKNLPNPYSCSVCGGAFFYESRPLGCTRCGSENSLVKITSIDEDLVPTKKKSVAQKGTVILGNLTIEPFEPFPSGIKSFDRVVGGLSKSFAIFIAGDKGVGKSTLVTDISMLHCLADKDRSVFYASAEEPLDRFVPRAFRLGYGCGRCAEGKWCGDKKHKASVEALKTRFRGSRETNIIALHNMIRKHRPSLVIYDSIRKFRHPDIKVHSHLIHGPEVVGEIIDLAEEIKCCVIAIIRLTKDGKLSGSEDMGYDFDAIVTLERHKPKGEKKPSKRRYVKLTCQKNRMGPEGKVGWFRMTNEGMLSVGKPTKVKPKKKVVSDGSSAKARAKAKAIARRRGNQRG